MSRTVVPWPSLFNVRLHLVSPAAEDGVLKAQDAAVIDAAECFACVADGVSASPYGGEAARVAVKYARRALGGDFNSRSVRTAMEGLHDELMAMRAAASVMELSFPSSHTAAMRKYMEEVFREKLHTSYQTTLSAVRLKQRPDGSWVAFVVWCGDSLVLAFDRAGVLLRTFPAGVTIPSNGRSTLVLPDHLDQLDADGLSIDEPCHIVLATDGFYNAFESPQKLFRWLATHEHDARPEAARHGDVTRALHNQLRAARGDDDITAVWISVEETVQRDSDPRNDGRSARCVLRVREHAPQRRDAGDEPLSTVEETVQRGSDSRNDGRSARSVLRVREHAPQPRDAGDEPLSTVEERQRAS